MSAHRRSTLELAAASAHKYIIGDQWAPVLDRLGPFGERGLEGLGCLYSPLLLIRLHREAVKQTRHVVSVLRIVLLRETLKLFIVYVAIVLKASKIELIFSQNYINKLKINSTSSLEDTSHKSFLSTLRSRFLLPPSVGLFSSGLILSFFILESGILRKVCE